MLTVDIPLFGGPGGTLPLRSSNVDYGSADFIVITGAGFGTKQTSAPVINDNFAGLTVDERLQDVAPQWQEYGTNGGAPVKSVGRYDGAQSAYHDYGLHQFATNYQTVTPVHDNLEQHIFCSYWIRIDNWDNTKDYGANKFTRITSSTGRGGGGVYNETGVHALQYPNSDGYTSCTYGPSSTGSSYWASRAASHNGQWMRVQYAIKIAAIGASNGYFRTQAGAEELSLINITSRPQGTLWTAGTYNTGDQVSQIKPAGVNAGVLHYFVATGTTTNSPFDGAGNVNSGWRTNGRQDYLVDSILNGLEQANPRVYCYVNTVLANTDYTAQITDGGPLVTYNSGPSPTANSIVVGLRDAIVTAGYGAVVLGDSIAGSPTIYKAVFDAKFTIDLDLSPRWYITDMYFDYSRKQIIFADNSVWANRTKTNDETQPWLFWEDETIAITPNMTNFLAGNCYAFLFDGDSNTGTLIGQVVPKSGGGWEIIYA